MFTIVVATSVEHAYARARTGARGAASSPAPSHPSAPTRALACSHALTETYARLRTAKLSQNYTSSPTCALSHA
eukprot:2210617-Pleurochrysis_carterae.AAC.1